MVSIDDYYRYPEIRNRMIEFLGGIVLCEATCVYINGQGEYGRGVKYRHPHEMPDLLDAGFDVARSVWDRENLLVDLDIEYVNFDFPAEPYLSPERAFAIQQPVEWAIERILRGYDCPWLHLMSGRGHHFQWNIRRDSRAYGRLVEIGYLPDYLEGVYESPLGYSGEVVGVEHGVASSGLSLLAEYLGHLIKEAAAVQCSIPVMLTAVEAGPSQRGREVVSVDISEYGDPLHLRALRVPFSVYLKPKQQRQMLGEHHVETFPVTFLVPRDEMDAVRSILVMRDAEQVVELARRTSVRIPDGSDAMDRFIDAYKDSDVAGFHEWFFSVEHDEPSEWRRTYDMVGFDELPPCVQHVFAHPNDLLLKPACLELVVRVFLALGWHPRHIAGLIRSKYERDYGWGARWYTYSAGMRADFYTRVFSGLFFVGRDNLVDFNCQSTREKGYCLSPCASCNLAQFRDSLLERRGHERLASGPVNRLFFADQHT